MGSVSGPLVGKRATLTVRGQHSGEQGAKLTAAFLIRFRSRICCRGQHNLLPSRASRLGGLLDEALQNGAREIDERLFHIFFRLRAGFKKSHTELFCELLALGKAREKEGKDKNRTNVDDCDMTT
jgi:hypothetical protein